MKERKRKEPRNEGEATEMSAHASKGTSSELVGERTERKLVKNRKSQEKH